MELLRRSVRAAFDGGEALLAKAFPPEWNPILNLGALSFLFYWIITASGIYLYIFFDTGVDEAYQSVECMTNEQWYAAGVMRSLHRYASDSLVLTALVHILREFGLDRYRGVRWFSWVTGVPVLILVFVAGITGYWLVWDKLAQYVAIVSTEWLDRLPIFGVPIARNFLSPGMLESRFFTLMMFIHIAVPLIALLILWLHLQRVTKPRINAPRGLAFGVFASLLVLSIAHPAVSQGPANLSEVPSPVGLDWFYLPLFPLLETMPGPVSWGAAATILVTMLAMPWLPPLRKPTAAVVDLANCNGCRRCYNDCPYNAISMGPRSDGMPFAAEAVVDPSLCVACGICAGACPRATPFRRRTELIPGIDLPDLTMAEVRGAVERAASGLEGKGRIFVFGCGPGVPLDGLPAGRAASVTLSCIGQLSPTFIDYVLSRNLADGVVLTGCTEGGCHARYGIEWTKRRIARTRDPYLTKVVPRERIRTAWVGRRGRKQLLALVGAFSRELETMSAKARSVDFRRVAPASVAMQDAEEREQVDA
jgi:quinol-cytochrome oxidoreductase complex cytochrome b subunit/coenzyme F420-reducing hydrogenase delta subunit